MGNARRLALWAVLTLAASTASHAQYFDWAAAFGGNGLSTDFANSVALDGFGNLYLMGQFADPGDFDLGPGTFLLSPNDQSVVVAKYTADGDLFWAVQFGGAHGSRVWPGALAVDN